MDGVHARPKAGAGRRLKGMFTFKERHGKLDFRSIMRIDIDKIVRDVDIDTLQAHLKNITFSKVDEKDLRNYTDEGIIKLFKLSQLIIEYMIAVQTTLHQYALELERRYNTICKEVEDERQRALSRKQEMVDLRKEISRKRKTVKYYEALLLRQQPVVTQAPASVHRTSHVRTEDNSTFNAMNEDNLTRPYQQLFQQLQHDFRDKTRELEHALKEISELKGKLSATAAAPVAPPPKEGNLELEIERRLQSERDRYENQLQSLRKELQQLYTSLADRSRPETKESDGTAQLREHLERVERESQAIREMLSQREAGSGTEPEWARRIQERIGSLAEERHQRPVEREKIVERVVERPKSPTVVPKETVTRSTSPSGWGDLRDEEEIIPPQSPPPVLREEEMAVAAPQPAPPSNGWTVKYYWDELPVPMATSEVVLDVWEGGEGYISVAHAAPKNDVERLSQESLRNPRYHLLVGNQFQRKALLRAWARVLPEETLVRVSPGPDDKGVVEVRAPDTWHLEVDVPKHANSFWKQARALSQSMYGLPTSGGVADDAIKAPPERLRFNVSRHTTIREVLMEVERELGVSQEMLRLTYPTSHPSASQHRAKYDALTAKEAMEARLQGVLPEGSKALKSRSRDQERKVATVAVKAMDTVEEAGLFVWRPVLNIATPVSPQELKEITKDYRKDFVSVCCLLFGVEVVVSCFYCVAGLWDVMSRCRLPTSYRLGCWRSWRTWTTECAPN